jgi:hypothetical protein
LKAGRREEAQKEMAEAQRLQAQSRQKQEEQIAGQLPTAQEHATQ